MNNEILLFDRNATITSVLAGLAVKYPQTKIVWCNHQHHDFLNLERIKEIFHHDKVMLSYNPYHLSFVGKEIGYIEESSFIKVNKEVTYPTWLMSGEVGVIHASVLNLVGSKIKKDANFDYFLNSVAKLGMMEGLFCYSEPQLLFKNDYKIKRDKRNTYLLFRFVKQHYKKRWLILLFLNLFLFEKRLPILPFCYALFFKDRKNIKLNFDLIQVQSTLKIIDNKTIDVIIPTIGRKQYLYDVLQDLAQQTHLPQKVIIVEQNPIENSVSELNYLITETWPFTIKHIFTHQAGACNARNLALGEVTSEWVFLNDDDNRFDKNLIENVFAKSIQYGVNAITTVYLQPNQIQYFNSTHQSGIFGSGNSFVKTNALAQISFDMSLEFGYGEDTDFGCQLRNLGNDIIYFPDLKITHLKAPMGGFRIKTRKQWEEDKIQPKPSPTIMYLKRKHFTDEQINSYKLIYFIKSIKSQSFIKWYSLYKTLQKGWESSIVWSKKI